MPSELQRGVHSRPLEAVDLGRNPLGAAIPTAAELLAARNVVAEHLQPTPFEYSPELSRRFGRSVWLKYENTQPIRSFKVRGALACMAGLDAAQRQAGVVTASTGNHGQGLAFAGRVFGIPVTVAAPQTLDPVKARAMAELGARILLAGETLSHATEAARQRAKQDGLTYIEDGEDPRLMAGAASIACEMLEAQPDLDSIVVPVGGGNLVAATLLASQHLQSRVAVVGVQSIAAPAATLSWLRGERSTAESHTAAGGLATEYPGSLALVVMLTRLAHMVLVDEEDLWRAVATGFEATGYPIEPAAAAVIAALDVFGAELPGERCGLLISGGRIGARDLCRALDLLAP
jgi:threonine dehydratase